MSTTHDRSAVLAALTARLGAERVTSDVADLLVYASDGSTLHDATPAGVVFPESTAEVVDIVTTCAAHGVPFVARGSGTGLSGGAMALDGGIVVALNRLRRILDVDVPNRCARVQPGVANLAISRAVEHHGLHYAPDPSSQAVCSIGGNVAHNSGGPHTLKNGVTVNHVLGLQIVLSDGTLVDVGGPERPGYDLAALITGSEGTFGIVTEVTVKLSPLPEGVRTAIAAFATIDDASHAVTSVIAGGLMPAALEMLDRVVVAALEAAFGLTFPPGAAALLLLECDGPEDGLDDEISRAVDICREHGALEVRLARDDNERAALWTARKKAFGALGRIARNYCTQDGVIPRTKLPEMLRRVGEIADRHRLRVANVFHAGDGNLHPCILFDDRDADERARVVSAGREILDVCLELGGSLSGEHGIGIEKREAMARMFAEDDLAVMRALREALDPLGLCNPHKVLPGGSRCVELGPGGKQVHA